MNDIKICVLGGDKRQSAMAQEMYNDGYEVTIFGLKGDTGGATQAVNLKSALCGADIVVLPLPFSTDGIRLSCPISQTDIKLDDVIALTEKESFVAGGKLTDSFVEKLNGKGVLTFDYMKSERLNILNSVPTAEGAIAIAVNELPITLFSSDAAVIGYGRIGRVLVRLLRAFGSNVTVYSRSESALSWAKSEGALSYHTSELGNYAESHDVIFNTVPSVVLDENILLKTKEEVLIIDLASYPGGVDFESAKSLDRKVIWALSIPGKTAPVSAGSIIKDCVITKYKEVKK